MRQHRRPAGQVIRIASSDPQPLRRAYQLGVVQKPFAPGKMHIHKNDYQARRVRGGLNRGVSAIWFDPAPAAAELTCINAASPGSDRLCSAKRDDPMDTRSKLAAALAETEAHIADCTQSAAEQAQLLAQLAPGTREWRTGEELLEGLRRSLRAWQVHRAFVQRMGQIASADHEIPAVPGRTRESEATRQRRLNDAHRWGLKAVEVQAAATNIEHPAVRASLLRLARSYELMAERAEAMAERGGKGKKSSSSG
jgi:hypothetical protein